MTMNTREEPIDNKKIADHTKEELEELFWETWDDFIGHSVFLSDAHSLLSAACPYIEEKCVDNGYESQRSRALLKAIIAFQLGAPTRNMRAVGRTTENVRTFEERGVK